MNKVLTPAIDYARNGFPLTELIAYYWGRSSYLKRFPGFEEIFLPNGEAPKKGEVVTKKEYNEIITKKMQEKRLFTQYFI